MRRRIEDVIAYRDVLSAAIEKAEADGSAYVDVDEQAEAGYQAALSDLDAAIKHAEKSD